MDIVFPQPEQIFNHTQAADILKDQMIKLIRK